MTLRYTRTAAWLHWTIAALIVVNIVIGISDGAIGSMRLHKSIGLTVLVLSLVRLAWRLMHRAPPFPDDISPLQRTLAKIVHALLYAAMIAVPLSGWLMVSNAPKLRPLSWFGLFDVPYLKLSPGVYDPAMEAHELLAYGFAVLIVGHLGAALYHHFVGRDHLIARMNPLARRDAEAA